MSEHIDGNVFVSNAVLSSKYASPISLHDTEEESRAKARREKFLAARDTLGGRGISIKRDSRNKHGLTFNPGCPDLIISVAHLVSLHRHIVKGMKEFPVFVDIKCYLNRQELKKWQCPSYTTQRCLSY